MKIGPILLLPALLASAALLATLVLPVSAFVTTDQYVARNIEGWEILINRHLLSDQAALGSQAITLLQQKLNLLRQVLPPHALSELQGVKIWLGVDDAPSPCSVYHPSRDWLVEHGCNPDKAKSVEIGCAQKFVLWSREQPMMVLHELAHAYQDRMSPEEQGQIKQAFEEAQKQRLYENVLYCNGTTKRAYALNNDREYFAETSEAYFGRNDFYPFTRADLERYDPNMALLLSKLWR